ncbi:MAG: hypothetical protein IPJ38_07215 [Dechloromonas sp.]|uniref:Uncharacterized protein n=1 Tax=Candidatus Dechloromonas phosphorivorans TaxID=2899244 RepID=A0A935MVP9_9RHOO|nr:hypothetical protein [Candidatus Dechloromonas phosphorivorans]
MNQLKRHFGQKAAFVSAIVCVALSLPMFGIFVWLLNERGMNDTWTPSALTTGFSFFLRCRALCLEPPAATVASARCYPLGDFLQGAVDS